MTGSFIRPSLVGLSSGLICLVVGAAAAFEPTVGFMLAVGAIGLFALAASAAAWVVAAIAAALTFPGLAALGALPSVATFLDIPLAWGALAVSLLEGGRWSQGAKTHLRWLLALAVACLLAWAFHPTELVRPVAYFLLLGEPFAIIGALLVSPPSPTHRRALTVTVGALVLVQLPIAAVQALSLGPGDPVQGTLYAAGAGAHVVSSVVVVGAFWLLARPSISLNRRLALAGPLFVVPFLAEARAVLFAVPIVLAGATRALGRRALVLATVFGIASVVTLLAFYTPGQASIQYLEQVREGQSGKAATASLVWNAIGAQPESLAFGLGPAQTVSRTAFLTTAAFLEPDSPLAMLGLSPAELATEAEGTAIARSAGGSSANSGLSSALGVLGDLGIFGAAVFIGMLSSVVLALWRVRSPEAGAAMGGLFMYAVLGVVFDWWEQPPFSVFVAVLAGLALTQRTGEEALAERGSGAARDIP